LVGEGIVVDVIVGGGMTMSTKDALALELSESVTVTVICSFVDTEGVPESTPAEESLRPVGSKETVLHVYGVLPPVAVRRAE
jgi:hypothetical protein